MGGFGLADFEASITYETQNLDTKKRLSIKFADKHFWAKFHTSSLSYGNQNLDIEKRLLTKFVCKHF